MCPSPSVLRKASFATESRNPGDASRNARLEGIFRQTPRYVNRELTFPCILEREPLYRSPEVTPAHEEVIAHHARTIILPRQLSKLRHSLREQVAVLASPYECGRVLEADEPIEIGDERFVLTIKGVGATGFFRETGAENRWMLPHQRTFTPGQKKRLSEFPFYQHWGLAHAPIALEEAKNA